MTAHSTTITYIHDTDTLNGHLNPFALAIAVSAGLPVHPGLGSLAPTTTHAEEPPLSKEEQALQQAKLEAANQFL